jgi:hypothetical protein
MAVVVVASIGLAACGAKEPSTLTFEQTAQELAKSADVFKAYVKGLDD